MRRENTYPRYWLFLLLGAAAAALALFLLSGSALAHYEESRSGSVTLRYGGNSNQIYLLSAQRDEEGELILSEGGYVLDAGDWVPLQDEQGKDIPNTRSLTFLLANTNHYEVLAAQQQTARLELFATAGVADPSALTVTLEQGGSLYTAIPTPVEEGSTWHKEYGPGWVYRFYNAAGEELFWVLRGGVFAAYEMTLTVAGTSQSPAALTLIASAEPSNF